MIEILPDDEIEQLLVEHFVGRIGCHADGRTYVVPITYAYADGSIYGHSTEGLKLRMMRKNPNVCFQADAVEDVFNWRSVIAWGTYEELQGEAAERAMRTLVLRFVPTKTQATTRSWAGSGPGVLDNRATVYRIRLIERTGRCERSSAHLVRVYE